MSLQKYRNFVLLDHAYLPIRRIEWRAALSGPRHVPWRRDASIHARYPLHIEVRPYLTSEIQ